MAVKEGKCGGGGIYRPTTVHIVWTSSLLR